MAIMKTTNTLDGSLQNNLWFGVLNYWRLLYSSAWQQMASSTFYVFAFDYHHGQELL